MEPFEFYLKKEVVRKMSPNPARARFLVKDAESRIEFLKNINMSKYPKIFFEHIYDIIRDFCDAILFADGYKSYSHEASISYLLKKDFDFNSVNKLDFFRYKRNGSKYYGEPITEDDAKNINGFFLSIISKLKKIVKDKLK